MESAVSELPLSAVGNNNNNNNNNNDEKIKRMFSWSAGHHVIR